MNGLVKSILFLQLMSFSIAEIRESALNDNNIDKEPTLHLVRRQAFEINIDEESPNNDSFPVSVTGSETIAELKAKIKALTGIPVEDQTLEFNGMVLQDDKTISFYNIQSGSTVDLFDQSR